MFVAALLLHGIHAGHAAAKPDSAKAPLKVIFETDMGNDIDDALALAMLYRYQQQGKVEILALSNNKQSINSVRYLDIMNHWYRYKKIPIGTVKDGKAGEDESGSFAQKIATLRAGEKPVFNSSIESYGKVQESVTLYRQILSAQPDSSVVIISVGFFTNLAKLLGSAPDKYSVLDGAKLVAKKVRFLSVMAGNFSEPKATEFNVKTDIAAAQKVYTQWPGIIYSSPFDVGNSILFPASYIERNLGYNTPQPVVEGYKLYLPMPYDRPTWDPTAALFAVEPNNDYFRLTPPGTITVDGDGYTVFSQQAGGRHYYLQTPDAAAILRIKARFIELTTKTGHP